MKYNCFVSYYFNQIVLVCNCEMKITVNYKLLFIVTVKGKISQLCFNCLFKF